MATTDHSTAPPGVLRRVRRSRSILVNAELGDAFVRSLPFAGAAAVAAALVWHLAGGAIDAPPTYLAPSLIAAVFLAFAFAGVLRRARRLPDLLAAAIELDRSAGTHSALASSLEFSRHQPGPFEAWALDIAAREAERGDLVMPTPTPVSRALPRIGIGAVLLTAAVVSALALAPRDWSAGAPTAVTRQVDPAALDTARQSIEQARVEVTEAATELGLDADDEFFESLEAELEQGLRDPDEAVAGAAERINELAEQAETEAERARETRDRAAERLAELEPEDMGTAGDLARALAEGDFDRAADEADRLDSALDDPDARDDLQRLADQLDRLAEPQPESQPESRRETQPESQSEPPPPPPDDQLSRDLREIADQLREQARNQPREQQPPASQDSPNEPSDSPETQPDAPDPNEQNNESANERANEQASDQPEPSEPGQQPEPTPGPGQDQPAEPRDRQQSDQQPPDQDQPAPDQPAPDQPAQDQPQPANEQQQPGQSEPQPSDQPSDQPADQPADQPGDQPGDQQPTPGDPQPAPQPNPQPGPQPDPDAPDQPGPDQPGPDQPGPGQPPTDQPGQPRPGQPGPADQPGQPPTDGQPGTPPGQNQPPDALERLAREQQRAQDLQRLADDLRQKSDELLGGDPNNPLGADAPPTPTTPPVDPWDGPAELVDARADRPPSEERERVISEWFRDPEGRPLDAAAPADAGRVLRDASDAAERAIEQQAVPRRHESLIRRVFERYAQRAAEASPQPTDADDAE